MGNEKIFYIMLRRTSDQQEINSLSVFFYFLSIFLKIMFDRRIWYAYISSSALTKMRCTDFEFVCQFF